MKKLILACLIIFLIFKNDTSNAQLGADGTITELVKRGWNLIDYAKEIVEMYQETKPIREKAEKVHDLTLELICMQKNWELYEKALNISDKNCLYNFEKKMAYTKLDLTLNLLDNVYKIGENIDFDKMKNLSLQSINVKDGLKLQTIINEQKQLIQDAGGDASEAMQGAGNWSQKVRATMEESLNTMIKELEEAKELVTNINQKLNENFIEMLIKKNEFDQMYYMGSMNFNI